MFLYFKLYQRKKIRKYRKRFVNKIIDRRIDSGEFNGKGRGRRNILIMLEKMQFGVIWCRVIVY